MFIITEETYIRSTGDKELDRVPLQVEMLVDATSLYNFHSAPLYVMDRYRKRFSSGETSGLWKEVLQLTPKCVRSDGLVG